MAKKSEVVKKPVGVVEPLKIRMRKGEDGKDTCDVELVPQAIEDSSGCKLVEAGSNGVLIPAIHAATYGITDPVAYKMAAEKILAMMAELHPRDGFEGMLISQMLQTHDLAMNQLGRLRCKASNSEMFSILLNQTAKLQRLFLEQVQALDRHRNRGQQRIVIERVDISGGQAIVGSVTGGVGEK